MALAVVFEVSPVLPGILAVLAEVWPVLFVRLAGCLELGEFVAWVWWFELCWTGMSVLGVFLTVAAGALAGLELLVFPS